MGTQWTTLRLFQSFCHEATIDIHLHRSRNWDSSYFIGKFWGKKRTAILLLKLSSLDLCTLRGLRKSKKGVWKFMKERNPRCFLSSLWVLKNRNVEEEKTHPSFLPTSFSSAPLVKALDSFPNAWQIDSSRLQISWSWFAVHTLCGLQS